MKMENLRVFLYGLNGGNKPWFKTDKMYYIIKNKYYNPEASNTICIYEEGQKLTKSTDDGVKNDLCIKINDDIYSCYFQFADCLLIFDKIKYCFHKSYNYYRVI